MSHLIIEQGNEVGREVAVPADGMKFGRSPANDLVLQDDAVMLFHGRFFFKSDGTLWVTDFGAGEKTTVGGDPVDEFQLSVGDLVEVGATAFRVISVAADAPLVEETIDLGFKGSKKVMRAIAEEAGAAPAPREKSALSHRVMQLGGAVLVLVVLLIVGPELLKLASKSSPSTAAPSEETLSLSYERVKGDSKNIFRYMVELDEEGNFSISIDDLKNNRHFDKTKKVGEKLRKRFSIGVDNTDFFDVSSDVAGHAPGQYDRYDITVSRNRKYHHIEVLNREPPPPQVSRLAALIEDFALSEIGVSPTLLKDSVELQLAAEQAFEVGRSKFAERDVRHGNLAKAIAHFKEVMLYLETFEPKPNLYHQAAEGLEQASLEQTHRYKEYMFQVDRAMTLGQWAEAERHLHVLSDLVPDRDDPRYDKISQKLMNVEDHLR